MVIEKTISQCISYISYTSHEILFLPSISVDALPEASFFLKKKIVFFRRCIYENVKTMKFRYISNSSVDTIFELNFLLYLS